jgi:hypothetical protein
MIRINTRIEPGAFVNPDSRHVTVKLRLHNKGVLEPGVVYLVLSKPYKKNLNMPSNYPKNSWHRRRQESATYIDILIPEVGRTSVDGFYLSKWEG